MTFERVSNRSVVLVSFRSSTYGLDGWASRAAGHTNTSRRLHKVCRANILALILLILGLEEIAESLHRIVDLAGAFAIAEEDGTICSTAGRGIWGVF